MAEDNFAVKKLKEKFPDSILEVSTFRGEVTVTVPKRESSRSVNFSIRIRIFSTTSSPTYAASTFFHKPLVLELFTTYVR